MMQFGAEFEFLWKSGWNHHRQMETQIVLNFPSGSPIATSLNMQNMFYCLSLSLK